MKLCNVPIITRIRKPTITKISDKLWDKICIILPNEKPHNTIGRPIIPYRKVPDGIVYVLRTGCQ
jgi:transposase